MFFVFLILENFFINSTKHIFFVFENKNIFQNSVLKHNFFFFLKTQKIVLNNFSQQFSKKATKPA